MQRQQGFTLLEVIIVITLLAGLSFLTLMNIPNQANDIHKEGRRLVSILELISQRSELERHIFGLQLFAHEWRVLKLCTTECVEDKVVQASSIWPEKYWYQTVQGKYSLHQTLPDNISIQLYIDNIPIELNTDLNIKIEPMVLFYPDEEITRFVIKLINSDNNNSIEIKPGNENNIDYFL